MAEEEEEETERDANAYELAQALFELAPLYPFRRGPGRRELRLARLFVDLHKRLEKLEERVLGNQPARGSVSAERIVDE
jgi:hypothetical protein